MKYQYGEAQHRTVEELQRFLSRTEQLLRTLNDEGVESTNVLRERVAVGVEIVQGELADAMEAADEASAAANNFIGRNPWTALALGAVAGAAIGWGISASYRIAFR